MTENNSERQPLNSNPKVLPFYHGLYSQYSQFAGHTARRKSPQKSSGTLLHRKVTGLSDVATTVSFKRNANMNNAINFFVLDRLRKMKSDVIKGIPKRTQNEKNSNQSGLNLQSTDRNDVALFIRSAMDFGTLEQSTLYKNMLNGVKKGVPSDALRDLGWYFKSQAIEAQKRFEVQKIQRLLTNHSHLHRLRRSSYSFMDSNVDQKQIKVIVMKNTLEFEKYVSRPGRKRFVNLKNANGKTKMLNSIEYENNPSIVKLEGVGKNKIVVNYSLTPLGSVMFYELLHVKKIFKNQTIYISLLPEYYMIGKFIQIHGYNNEELLLRYLNIQSNNLKKDLERKGIVRILLQPENERNELRFLIKNGNRSGNNSSSSQSDEKLQSDDSDDIGVVWTENESVGLLYQIVAEFFASLKLFKNESTNIHDLKSKIQVSSNEINEMIGDNGINNDTLFRNLKTDAYKTLLKHIHGAKNGSNVDTQRNLFKNLSGRRIESVDFREILIKGSFQKILKPNPVTNNDNLGRLYPTVNMLTKSSLFDMMMKANEEETLDIVKRVFKKAVESYVKFLITEDNLRKYNNSLKNGTINNTFKNAPLQRENDFRLKEFDLRVFEEVLLLFLMKQDRDFIKNKLKGMNESELQQIILKGDESAMFTNPYIDRHTLFQNMNLHNNGYQRVLSNGIYIDDSQFVFDYLSRKYLNNEARIKQYIRYLKLLEFYSSIRNDKIQEFYKDAKNAKQNKNNKNKIIAARNASADIIVKCDFLITNIIDAVNEYNQFFKTRFNGIKFIEMLSDNFSDKKYTYIKDLFKKLVEKYNKALDEKRKAKLNETISFKYYTPNGIKLKTVDKTSSYRTFLKETMKVAFTQGWYEYSTQRPKNKTKNDVYALQMEELNERRKTIFYVQEKFYPWVAAFQNSGFADDILPRKDGRSYDTKEKMLRDFEYVYGKGMLNSKMRMIMLYDFLQLISGIDVTDNKLLYNIYPANNSANTNELKNKLNDEIGYNVFQGGEFHHKFGMVFSPFLPAYYRNESQALTPPALKRFEVIKIPEILEEKNFNISWPLQLYGGDGDSFVSAKMSQTMLKKFDFRGHFDEESKSTSGYLTGFGNRITVNSQNTHV